MTLIGGLPFSFKNVLSEISCFFILISSILLLSKCSLSFGGNIDIARCFFLFRLSVLYSLLCCSLCLTFFLFLFFFDIRINKCLIFNMFIL